jgi:hypothetical protein
MKMLEQNIKPGSTNFMPEWGAAPILEWSSLKSAAVVYMGKSDSLLWNIWQTIRKPKAII